MSHRSSRSFQGDPALVGNAVLKIRAEKGTSFGKEGAEVEFKSALGGFPGSFWETYSAFANTKGGVIVLGVKEKNHRFTPDGFTDEQVDKYKKTFWDCANNKGKVSHCLLMDKDVIEGEFDGKKVLVFVIPRAPFDVKPVYINGNPNQAFKRNHEGDYLCTKDEISRMFADAMVLTNPQDSRILKNFTLERDLTKPPSDSIGSCSRYDMKVMRGMIWAI